MSAVETRRTTLKLRAARRIGPLKVIEEAL